MPVIVLETLRGVSVAEDRDSDGVAIYRVLKGRERLGPFKSKLEAQSLASVIRPRKVVCDNCHATDIESFPLELGIGCLRATGDGGWLRERYFEGKSSFVDRTVCPDCVEKHQGDRIDG